MLDIIKTGLLFFTIFFHIDLFPDEIKKGNLGVSSSEEIIQELSKIMPEANISESEIEGIYSVSIGSMIGYVSKDGNYILRGDIYDMETNENLTEVLREESRANLLRELEELRMIIFSPDEFDHTVTIFTDIDCGYCRKFHSQINQVMDQRIRVRYMFFPRSGPDTESWHTAEKVWCSNDKLKAMTKAKKGISLNSKVCSDNPVNSHYLKGIQFNVRGTPTMITDKGKMIIGYMEAESLRARLDSD